MRECVNEVCCEGYVGTCPTRRIDQTHTGGLGERGQEKD